MSILTVLFFISSAPTVSAQCNLVFVEGGCTAHFTFDKKLELNISFVTSYSIDFGDGDVLQASNVDFGAPFSPAHYNASLGFYETNGKYNDLYHYYCDIGETYTYTITLDYLDKWGNPKTFTCSETFVFDSPNPWNDCVCETTTTCDFMMIPDDECITKSLEFEGTSYASIYTHKYYFGSNLVHSSYNPNWTLDLENYNLCDVNDVTYIVEDYDGTVICNVTKPLPIEPGLYIGNHDCTPLKISDLVVNNVLPPATYSGNCPIFITGEVIVDQDYSFEASQLHFDSGAGLTAGDQATGNTAILTIKDSHLKGCEALWRGIRIYPGSTLDMNSSTIQDAMYAIRPMSVVWPNQVWHPRINMFNASLQNNFIGLFAVDGRFELANFFGNSFSGGDILGIGGGCPLENILQTQIALGMRSYAGIYVDGAGTPAGANLQLGLGSNFNNFDNLAVGINARNENFDIRGCNFSDISANGYFIDAGTGISFNDGTGISRLDVRDGTFSNVLHGIVANALGGVNTVVSVSGTQMSNMGSGISTNAGHESSWAGDFSTVAIFDNDINLNGNLTTSPVGIYNKDTYNGSPFSLYFIKDNSITGDDDASIGIWMNTPLGNPSGAIEDGFDTNPIGNSITLNGLGGAGIHLLNVPNMFVTNNDVFLSDGGFGIDIRGNNDHYLNLSCNRIENTSYPGGNWSQAFFHSGNADSDINLTIANNTHVGMRFAGANMGADIAQNKIGDPAGSMVFGLLYQNANTGSQINKGNRWFGNFSGWGALANGSSFLSEYVVFNGNDQNPPSVNPLGWFDNTGVDVPEEFCPLAPSTPVELFAFSASDYTFMTGESTYSYAGLDWDYRAYLLEKIQDSLDLLNDPIVNAFYTSSDNTEVLAMMSLKDDVVALFDISVSQQAQLDNYQAQIEFVLAELDSLDVLLSVNPNDNSLLNDYSFQVSFLSDLREAYQSLWDSIVASRRLASDGVLANLAAFQPTSLPSENNQIALTAYVNSQIKGDSLSNLSTLEATALICPAEGGSVVHFASGVYSAITGISLPMSECDTGKDWKTGSLTHGILEAPKEAVTGILPNPGTDELTITLAEEGEYNMSIVSLTGKTMQSASFQSTSTFNTTQLPSGMYIIQILSEDGYVNQSFHWYKLDKK